MKTGNAVTVPVAGYDLRIHPRVSKELRRLRKGGRADVARRIREAFERLREDPTGAAGRLDVKKLAVAGGRTFRLRVGDYRVLMEIEWEEGTIYVTRLFHRGASY